MAKKSETLYRWRVYHIKATPAEFIGSVDAPDAQTAIELSIAEYSVSPEKHNRLMAVKIAVQLEDT